MCNLGIIKLPMVGACAPLDGLEYLAKINKEALRGRAICIGRMCCLTTRSPSGHDISKLFIPDFSRRALTSSVAPASDMATTTWQTQHSHYHNRHLRDIRQGANKYLQKEETPKNT